MLSFFPQDVLDEIWDLIESVSEGFPTYSSKDHILYFSIFSKHIAMGGKQFQQKFVGISVAIISLLWPSMVDFPSFQRQIDFIIA